MKPVCFGLTLHLFVATALGISNRVDAQPNCNTALSRIAKAAAERAITENQNTACAGFRQGDFAIDKTRALQLGGFKVCEDGPVVVAELSVHIECATSDAAFIRVQAADTLFARATANLDTCVVTGERVWANGSLANAGLSFTNATKKLKEAAAKEIKQYCVRK